MALETIDAAKNSLALTDPEGKTVVDFQLASNRAYGATDFTASGRKIFCTEHPTG